MDPNSSINFVGVAASHQFVAPGPDPEEVSFINEIKSMLFAFGDSRNPRPETASLIEEICQQQMSEIVIRASEVAATRGSKTVGIEDILFLMRKSPIRIQRLIKYLGVMEVVSSLKNAGAVDGDVSGADAGKRVRRCREFLRQIDTDPRGVLSRAANEELVDEGRMERLRRLDRFSRDMDERRYSEFTRARKVSFLGHQMKLSQNFQDWILQAIPIETEILTLDRSCLEGLGYLAYETVGQLVDIGLFIRHEETNTDPILRQMAPVVYNGMYRAEANDHAMDDKVKTEPSFSRPLEPKHVTEAMRRICQRPKPMGRVSKAARSSLFELIAL